MPSRLRILLLVGEGIAKPAGGGVGGGGVTSADAHTEAVRVILRSQGAALTAACTSALAAPPTTTSAAATASSVPVVALGCLARYATWMAPADALAETVLGYAATALQLGAHLPK